jgi:O-antigen/teichoic acid export membrane protein
MGLGASITKSVWSRSLDEARDASADFRITRNTAVFLQVGFGCAGLLFVFFGRPIVDAITNGKFDDAASYIPALMVIALIQISAGSASAVVYASGAATSAAWFRTASVLTSLLMLYPAIKYFGIKGILALYIIESVGYRVFLRALAARLRAPPFQDEVAVFACIAIGAAATLIHFVTPSLTLQFVLFLASALMLLIVGRHANYEAIPMRAKLRPVFDRLGA